MKEKKAIAPRPKMVSVLDCLQNQSEKEIAAELKRNYEVTDLDVVNLVALARLGEQETLLQALACLKPRNAQ